jgi:hypothetical protein
MHQIKIFTDEDTEKLEAEINLWLKQNPSIKIVQMVQSESCAEAALELEVPCAVTITLLYKA